MELDPDFLEKFKNDLEKTKTVDELLDTKGPINCLIKHEFLPKSDKRVLWSMLYLDLHWTCDLTEEVFIYHTTRSLKVV